MSDLYTKTPSVALQLPAANIQSSSPTVLSSVNHFIDIFDKFFSVGEQVHQKKLQGYQEKAFVDATLGKKADNKITSNVYDQTYRRVSGARTGYQLADDFYTNVYPTLGIQQDFEQERLNFLNSELQNNGQIGTGDSEFDNGLIEAFLKETDKAKRVFLQEKTHALQDINIQNHKSITVRTLDDGLTLDTFSKLASDRQIIEPLKDQSKIHLDILNELIGSAENRPNQLTTISRILNETGFDKDTNKSFSDLYPLEAKYIQDKLLENYRNGITIEGQQEYDSLQDKITTASDLMELTSLLKEELPSIFSQFGNNILYSKMKHLIISKAEKLGQQTANTNLYFNMVDGKVPYDKSKVQSLQRDAMTTQGIDPWVDPQKAAVFVNAAQTANTDLQFRLGSALKHPENIQSFSAAYSFFQTLEKLNGKEQISAWVPSSDLAYYDFIRDEVQLGNRPLEEVALNLKDSMKKIENLPKLNVLMDKSSWSIPYAETQLRKRIKNQLEKSFDSSVEVNEETMKDLTSLISTRMALGKTWKSAVDDLVQQASSSLSLYPGINHSVVVGETNVNAAVPFGRSVVNPQTGYTENTLKTFQSDIKSFSKIFPEIKPLSDFSSISVDANSVYGLSGEYLVLSNERPIIFEFGSSYSFLDADGLLKTMKFSSNPNEIHEAASTLGSKRFSLINGTNIGIQGYILGYTPGFTKKLKTIEEQEYNYAVQHGSVP